MTDKGTCWRCRWFDCDAGDEDGEGFCRRFPPTMVSVDEDTGLQFWPSVEYIDWCGEFREECDALVAGFGRVRA